MMAFRKVSLQNNCPCVPLPLSLALIKSIIAHWYIFAHINEGKSGTIFLFSSICLDTEEE